jgi:hypothetical protein
MAGVSNSAVQQQRVVDIRRLFKIQVVNANGCYLSFGMAPCHHGADNVNPFNQPAAEEPVVAVDVLLHNYLYLLRLRILYIFEFFHIYKPFSIINYNNIFSPGLTLEPQK